MRYFTHRLILAAAALCVATLPAQGQTRFSDRDFSGSWAFWAEGQVHTGPITGRLTTVGTIQADGRGRIRSAFRTLSIGGTVLGEQTAIGRYTVNRNGTGTIVYTNTTAGLPRTMENFAFTLRNRNNLLGLSTDPTSTVYAEAKRQATPRGGFRTSDLRGNYAFEVRGEATGAGFGAAIGFLRANGGGRITEARRVVNQGGTLFEDSAVATFQVEPDGTSVVRFRVTPPNGQPVDTVSAFVLVSPAEIFSVPLGAGAAFLGTARRQSFRTLSERDLAGSWAAMGEGVSITGSGSPEALAFIATLDADSRGGASGLRLANTGGQLGVPESLRGRYSLSRDGFGSVTYSVQPGGQRETLAFIAIDHDELFFVSQDTTSVSRGILRRRTIPRRGFMQSDFRGSQAFSLQGVVPAAPATGFTAGIGVFTPNGRGQVTGAQRTINVAGSIMQESGVGSYQIGRSGIGLASFRLRPTNDESSFAVVLLNRSETFALGLEPGGALVGRGWKQTRR